MLKCYQEDLWDSSKSLKNKITGTDYFWILRNIFPNTEKRGYSFSTLILYSNITTASYSRAKITISPPIPFL